MFNIYSAQYIFFFNKQIDKIPNIFSEDPSMRRLCQEKLEKLARFFPEKDIFTLSSPILQEGHGSVTGLEEMEVNQFRPEFVLETMKLRNRILQIIPLKLIFGQHTFIGEVFGRFLKTCVDYLNQDSVTKVSLPKIIDNFGKKECEMAFEGSLDNYVCNMNIYMEERMPVLEEELKKIHKAEKEASLMLFHQRAMGDKMKEYEVILSHNIKEKFVAMMNFNEHESHVIQITFFFKQIKLKF